MTAQMPPQGYLPGQLYKLDSSYGNKAQLQELTAALKAAGLRPIADIVINHRCADQQDENGIWNMFKCATASTFCHRGKMLVSCHSTAQSRLGLFLSSGHHVQPPQMTCTRTGPQ